MEISCLESFGKLISLLYLGEANILVIQKSKDKRDWAHILLNVKYKYFKVFAKERKKLSLVLFTNKKDLVLYFDEEENLKIAERIIRENKAEITLKELLFFNERLVRLKKELNIE